MPITFPYQQEMVAGCNTFAFVGDSRLSQIFADSTNTYGNNATLFPVNLAHLKTNHFFNWANTQLNQRMKIVFNGAVSGMRSDQYLWCMPQAIASGANWLVLWSIVNDVGQSGTTGDTAKTIWARIKAAAQQALIAGMNVIIVSETGTTSLNSASMGICYQYNEYAREFCEVTAGAFFYDINQVVVSPVSSTMAFNAGYSDDGTHLNGYGSYFAGVDFAAWISSFVLKLNCALGSPNEVAAQGNIQQVANPTFQTTTGGIAGSGVTGNVPASYNAGCSGSVACAISVGADPSGYGNAVTATLTATGAGGFQIHQDTTLANYTIPNDVVQSGCQAVLSAGATNVSSIYLGSNFGGTANPTADLWPLSATNIPQVAMTLELKSVPFIIPAGTTWATWQMNIAFSGAGSATLLIRRPWMRRRFAV